MGARAAAARPDIVVRAQPLVRDPDSADLCPRRVSMAKKAGLKRRDFLKLTGTSSLLAVAASAFPRGAFGATPSVKGPIKIGYQAVLSGTLAGYGEFHKMGATMAVDEINAKGG